MKASAVNWLPWTPFDLSSTGPALRNLLSALSYQRVDFMRDIPFEAADGFQLGAPFGDFPGNVRFGSRIRAQPPYRNDMQGAVGGAVSAAVQAVGSPFRTRLARD